MDIIFYNMKRDKNGEDKNAIYVKKKINYFKMGDKSATQHEVYLPQAPS